MIYVWGDPLPGPFTREQKKAAILELAALLAAAALAAIIGV